MDKKPSTRVNNTEAVVLKALDYVVGQESGAWVKWWARAQLDIEGIGIALYAALLSLGPPPAPEHLTSDLTQIALSSLPPKGGPGVSRRDKAEWNMHREREENRLDRRWRSQRPYNHALNAWVSKHGLVYRHRTQCPAQFRKLFAAFVLHACKENDSE